MIGDEVEDETQSALVQAFAQAGKGTISAEVCVDVIVADRKAGSGDIEFLEIW